MTEAEWLTSDDPTAMLEFLRTCERLPGPLPPSDRKLRLFAYGCTRSFYADFLDDPDEHPSFTSAIERAEASADAGERPRSSGWIFSEPDAAFAARCTVDDLRERRGYDPHKVAAVVRCIFGNPFRPYIRCPHCLRGVVPTDLDDNTCDFCKGTAIYLPKTWLAWNDYIIPRLTQAIYDDRAWDRLPILADAMEEAGCDDEAILGHLRGPRPHARGCHVLDLILGKG